MSGTLGERVSDGDRPAGAQALRIVGVRSDADISSREGGYASRDSEAVSVAGQAVRMRRLLTSGTVNLVDLG